MREILFWKIKFVVYSEYMLGRDILEILTIDSRCSYVNNKFKNCVLLYTNYIWIHFVWM